MTAEMHLFVGPSLPPSAQPRVDGLIFHGPAAQGDVYALVARRPLAIGIIDGYFERVPAVWHKEVLYAMSEGIHVFGAASMGALRAIELAEFGMLGVGQVYRDFASGELSDDDEVTIVHAPEELDYRPGSEALVNMRATLTRARAEGILSAEQHERLLGLAKGIFYPDRSYAELLARAKAADPGSNWETLAAWLRVPTHRLDVKRQDALELLRAMLEFREQAPRAKQVDWTFQHTDAWEQVRRALPPPSSDSQRTRASLRALAVDATRCAEASAQANLRALRIELSRRDRFNPTQEDVSRAAAALVQRAGWSSVDALKRWLEAQGMSDSDLERLLRDEACAEQARTLRSGIEELALVDYLRLHGFAASLHSEARGGLDRNVQEKSSAPRVEDG